MIQKDYPLSKLAQNEWLSFAMYTVESRAIPNMIDGLKVVQRMVLYSSIQNSYSKFKKVSAVAGVVSDYGYNHGESSASGALQLMAADWSNNICLVEGQGSFGTRLVPAAAAARYTYTKVHNNFHKYMQDINLAPEHSDPEHIPPAFYIPVIPLVLANGAMGIATGFKVDILPRDPEDIARACKEYIEKGKIGKRLKVKFPQFSGTVKFNETENRFYIYGVIDRKSKTQISIKEVPYGHSRESYIKILDKLEENGKIVSYDDLCDKQGFCFDVKLKNEMGKLTDDELLSEFKLVKTASEIITVIDYNGKLRQYTDERELVKDFCDYRNTILTKRISTNIARYSQEAEWLRIKMDFINLVLDGKIIFKNRKKDDVSGDILTMIEGAKQEHSDRLLRMNIMSLTKELVEELKKEIKETLKTLDYWKKTTEKEQFLGDLNSL